MDLCPVCEGPLGVVYLQPPAPRQPSQALPHGSQLRLALCVHSNADALTPGGPKVSLSNGCFTLNSVFVFHDGLSRDDHSAINSYRILGRRVKHVLGSDVKEAGFSG